MKLRQLRGYKIASREFAAAFRTKFKRFEPQWSNVRVDFGPLTLMEGWEKLDTGTLAEDVCTLAGKFLEIAGLIDELLEGYKLSGNAG